MPARNNIPKKTSSAADFKKKNRGRDVELPSGQVVKLSHKSLQSFIISGQIPNSLLSVINSISVARQGGTEEEVMHDLLENPEQLKSMFDIVDTVVMVLMIEPKCHPIPDDEDDRDDDLLYIDELEDADKMYIFTIATGGTTDLESFRGELAAGVDLVQQRENVVKPAKRPPRAK